MNDEAIITALKIALVTVAQQARIDATAGESDIGSVFEDELDTVPSLDLAKLEETIRDINKAAATKEGMRRLVNGIMIAARLAAKLTNPS